MLLKSPGLALAFFRHTLTISELVRVGREVPLYLVKN